MAIWGTNASLDAVSAAADAALPAQQAAAQASWLSATSGNDNGTGPATSASTSASTLSGSGIVNGILAQYGLQSLAAGALQAYTDSGNSADYLAYWITQQPAFNTMYPAYNQLAAKGQGITIDDYQNYIKTTNALAAQYGVPSGYFTPDRIAQGLLNNQSTTELNDELSKAAAIVSDPNVQAWMSASATDGGLGGHMLTPGEIYAQATDPTQSETSIINRLTAAQIGGAALASGQHISTDLATNLQSAGVTQSAAQTGFQDLANQSGLFQALPGNAGDQGITQSQAVNAEFNLNPSDVALVQQQAQARVNAFKGGGSFATGQGGFAGLGQANAA